ncbi:MAG TPA: D-alanyl-D-alanine carboxypeptidase [Clostridiaceae bacterium]|jgi:D-alanyl-D-alanine carboxypeptidase (penicillin-binding protein 5/6)|nr:D-alanyl-D-alanine carboxypeptidase [Clostridiaceae bacterium]
MKYIRYLFILLLAVAVSFTHFSPVIAEFDVDAQSAILIEASTGQVVFEKNADIPMPPASITKIMTLFLAFEALDKGDITWEDQVVVSEDAWRMDGSEMFLNIGTKVSVGDLITGISVVSANDGCIALAEYLYGSEKAFVEAMNKKAKELGLKNTQFKNSNGLPAEGHYMSARDIAILARELITRHPRILELESMREFTYNGIKQYNRNPLLGVFPGADGLKTGWTEEAGYCLVGTAVQNDMRMISVVLKTENEEQRLKASRELLSYGFRNFEKATLVWADSVIGERPVKDGKELSVEVIAKDDISAVVPIDSKDKVEKIAEYSKELVAPVSKGEVVGTLKLELDGRLLGQTDILVNQDVARAGFFVRLFRWLSSLFGK